MLRQIRFARVFVLSLGLFVMAIYSFGQAPINNGTRAVFIFDIAK
jgi:hypothetical protein